MPVSHDAAEPVSAERASHDDAASEPVSRNAEAVEAEPVCAAAEAAEAAEDCGGDDGTL